MFHLDPISSTPRMRLAFVLAIGLGILGCSSGPKTYPVKGKVVFKDTGKPLSGGTVLFESVADPNIKASGDLEPDGSFELGSNVGKMGVVQGEHRILIMPPLPEYGPELKKGVIHPRYQRFETSELKFTVTPGDNYCEIQLERPK